VYDIGRQRSPDGKEVKNSLSRAATSGMGRNIGTSRGNIVAIEPVSSGLLVAWLIKEARDQKPQPSQQE
jgi:hypothetical protein